MNIGLSSACFYPDTNTEDTIEIMKKLGFNSGEIFLNSFYEYEESFAQDLKMVLEKNNFEAISVHAFGSAFEPFLFDRYERRRKDLLKVFKSVCRAGKILGAKYYTFHGMRLGLYSELSRKFIVDIYDELIYTAGEIGISLSQENVSWCMSSQMEFLSMLIEECREPVCFTLDIKQAYKAEKKPEDYISIMKGKIVNLHINDRDDENVCLLPGKGTVEYGPLFKALENSGYDGNAVIEVYNSNFKELSQLKEAADCLKKYTDIF